MAAEVPAKDVLCEAMEYLTKLGSNLRTRSESLRNKRIRREKLNNVLAVQKAASKVLLICQLSKKSLENVESGVRKILQHIDTSQATSNGSGKKSDTRKVRESSIQNSTYHYIKYKSRKLRIKNRISFKHYNSVRVYAKSLPKSVLDKYPVHYDCKLYRMRKKQAQLEQQNEQVQNKITEESKDVSVISIPDTLNPKSLREESIENDKIQNDVSIISIPDSPEPKNTDGERIVISSIDKESRKSSVEVIEDRRYSTDKDESPRKHTSEKHSSTEKNNKETNSSEASGTEKNNALETESNGKKAERKKSSKRKRVISDDSSGDDKGDPKTSNKSVQESDSKKTKIDEGSDDGIKPPIDENIKENNKDSDSGSDSKRPMIKCVNLSMLLKPEVLVKEKINHNALYKPRDISKELNYKLKEFKSEEVKRSERKERKEQEYWAQKRNEISTFKPKSFVINVTKLPELSHDYLRILSLKRITQGGLTVCEIADEESVKEQEDDYNDESAGISQKTNVNRPDIDKSCTNSDQDDDLIAEANKVKKSLLNNSDSEDSISLDNELKSSKNDSELIKNALLNDSDSDNNKSDNRSDSSNDKEKDKDSVSEADQAKKAMCIKSDSTQDRLDSESYQQVINYNSKSTESIQDAASSDKLTNNVTSENDDNNKDINSIVKDSDELVNRNDENLSESQSNENERTPEKKPESHLDSSDDETKTPLSKRFTPQSKTKRMRESIHAKKMLMTYSSSDTEDEQLSNALKEIKKSLLHGSDDEKKGEKMSRESSHSSSEDIILKKTKKKKKYDSDSKRKRNAKYKKIRQAKKYEHESEDSDSSVDSKSSNSKMVRSKSKPGNSSCQNSDGPDSNDKDIDGLANMKTLQQSRRRSSSEKSEETIVTSNTRSKLKTKPTGLISEEMLKAESSSESAEASADENMDNTDLQEVTVPSFNGVSDHLEKDNLLEESDSSVSQNVDEMSGIKEETDSDENPNAKRRKAVLSSDSEGGSSRKKNNDASVKMSDFEDSDDSVNNKRNKRKKKAADSDASAGSVSSSLEEGKKKRRRIRSVKDSDASDSESETEGRNKHGRKNIRKVMGKNQLEEATKKAAREEKERIARIAERQKIYNNLEFDESGKPDEVVLDKVVLDFDPETKEPLIEVDRGLVKKLKPHQANGIKFMWNACFESVKRIKKDKGSGCILAHCMGLGKTLQVVTLTHTLLTHGDLTSVNRVLVVCPLSTVLNWVNEFRMWLKFAETEFDVEVFELSRYKQNSERAFQLSQWCRHGGVCVLGYEMFRNLSADNSKKYKKKMLKTFQEALVDPGPDLVVCDEGHLLKNEKTSLSQSMNKVKTYRRIVLTGTPLQNNLKEYYCMVQFVKPNLLGKYNEYLNRFVNPITNGQYTDSTEHDIKIMKRRSHVLHKMLDGAVQRRDYGVLAPFLPPKHEYVLFITLAEVQTKLYQHYLDNFSRKPLPGKSSGFLFPDFQSLQRIWTHPLVLKYNSERYEIMQQKKRDKEEEEDSEGSLRDFIDDDSTSEDSMSDDSTDDSSDVSDDSRKKNKKKKKSNKKSKGKDKDGKGEGGLSRSRRATRANPVEIDEEDKADEVIEMKYENPTEWWIKLVTEDVLEDMRNSHKLVLLFDILRQCDAIGDKLLVFSQSLYSLDLIEHFLGKVDDATQEGRIDDKLGGHIGTWSPGVDYFRLDGSTSCENRSIWCKNFNREDNPRARLFLISTRAGGLGINLVAANRVVIFDVSWNPSHDVQSIFRVYRFGQKKPCYVYRFLAMGTMEEKIYERQVTKQAISKRVIDEQQIDRHYAENDLAELYKFEPQPPTPRPIPPLPKDRLFAEMLREHEVQIYKYHEHDSLLENKEEETLSEEERKAAWEDFENEKNKPPPAPFPSAWQANMLQQQQLTYAALAAMLRKDMPNVSDNQLRDMIPLIYNANPQLMQKLSEIYKYSPAMMNPGMMNPAVMNPVAAAGMGGLGGASGLQYEPPWQRQHQQQQQMRLQQLLQQQNPMGAKFYAGGLGSRDPVAMALQHQRAREIMMSNSAGGAGRPRGRPPMQPLAPPTGDVVNLDSD